jgi:hypothetical protein
MNSRVHYAKERIIQGFILGPRRNRKSLLLISYASDGGLWHHGQVYVQSGKGSWHSGQSPIQALPPSFIFVAWPWHTYITRILNVARRPRASGVRPILSPSRVSMSRYWALVGIKVA